MKPCSNSSEMLGSKIIPTAHLAIRNQKNKAVIQKTQAGD